MVKVTGRDLINIKFQRNFNRILLGSEFIRLGSVDFFAILNRFPMLSKQYLIIAKSCKIRKAFGLFMKVKLFRNHLFVRSGNY